MKKIIIFVMALALLLAFASCSNHSGNADPILTTDLSTPSPTSPPDGGPHDRAPYIRTVVGNLMYRVENDIIMEDTTDVILQGQITPFCGGTDELDGDGNLVVMEDPDYMSDYGTLDEKLVIRLGDGWHYLSQCKVQPGDFMAEALRILGAENMGPFTDLYDEEVSKSISAAYCFINAAAENRVFYIFYNGKCGGELALGYVDGEICHTFGYYKEDVEQTIFSKNNTAFSMCADEIGREMAISTEEAEKIAMKYDLESLGVQLRTAPIRLRSIS